MKKIYFFGLFIFSLVKVNSQVNYTFSTATGTYTSIVGTNPTLTAVYTGINASDEGYANSIPIGFPFNYNGTAYTTVSANTNGFLSFVNMVPRNAADDEQYYFDDLNDGPYIFSVDIRPVIAPFWDDLDLQNPTNLRYETTGLAGSRVFTMEWANVKADYNAASAVLSFQVKFFEATGIVEFRYRSEPGAYNQTAGETDGSSIGITSTAYGSGSYLSLNNASAAPTASSTTSTSTILTKPATGQIYRFTPTFALPISLLSFKAEKLNGLNKISWTTASEQNNKGFELQRSADGKTFTSINFVESKGFNGNSSSSLAYYFDDVKPLRGNSFYRLKQVDKDNKSMFSQVVLIKGSAATRLEIRNVFPNPAVSSLNLLLSLPENDKLNLVVSDLSGKVVLMKTFDANSGENSINLNVSKLSTGNYTIKAQCSGGCEPVSVRFVKR